MSRLKRNLQVGISHLPFWPWAEKIGPAADDYEARRMRFYYGGGTIGPDPQVAYILA